MEGDMELRILVTVILVPLALWYSFTYLLPSWHNLVVTEFSIFAIQEWGNFLMALLIVVFIIAFLFFAYSKIGKTQ